jgi:RNA polymerase sigma-70 factor (ECF subfamily)
VETIKEQNLTDSQLVDRVLSGNTKAFTQVVKQTQGLVTQIIFKMIYDREVRKDMAQDVYMKAYSHLSTFRFQAKLSTWIGQIAYNTCLNYLEKRKPAYLQQRLEENEEIYVAGTSHPLPEATISETEIFVFNQELSHILLTEIDKLPPVYRTLVTLYHQEDLTYTQIAQITNLPEGTVKNYLFRARKVLKQNLLSQYPKDEL